ncbi:hypothetical protein FDP41_005362 [Naegleria fowleri]|uniref:Uncharacterized protein n=1 Tax=Naegleria fowleri TaxID=5763 RepID=A0A6A5BMJ3_NAEFO|nr:uncharacterized protein FDP41_005362 [Naegleria fowleri]KAF0975368.1 hypothetical protein FDP41_005362 [Naegleria fowleri]
MMSLVNKQQTGSKKRKDLSVEEKIAQSITYDERDGEEVDFILETGVCEFKPTYSSWNEFPNYLKPYYGVIWDVFSTCERCITNRHMEMKDSSTVHPITPPNLARV